MSSHVSATNNIQRLPSVTVQADFSVAKANKFFMGGRLAPSLPRVILWSAAGAPALGLLCHAAKVNKNKLITTGKTALSAKLGEQEADESFAEEKDKIDALEAKLKELKAKDVTILAQGDFILTIERKAIDLKIAEEDRKKLNKKISKRNQFEKITATLDELKARAERNEAWNNHIKTSKKDDVIDLALKFDALEELKAAMRKKGELSNAVAERKARELEEKEEELNTKFNELKMKWWTLESRKVNFREDKELIVNKLESVEKEIDAVEAASMEELNNQEKKLEAVNKALNAKKAEKDKVKAEE